MCVCVCMCTCEYTSDDAPSIVANSAGYFCIYVLFDNKKNSYNR